MKLLLLIPLLISCLPQSPKDKVVTEPIVFDPLASEAWHLENTGQHAFSDGFGIPGEDHQIKKVHELGYTGKGIRIAISDNGLQVKHPDLVTNELPGEHRDYVTGISPYFFGNPVPADIINDAHGTAVTGLIAAEKGNTIGSYGVAPDAQFAGFNYLSSDQDPTHSLHQYSGDFRIFNYSYGLDGYFITSEVEEDIEEALRMGVQRGSIYVKAGGNSFQEEPQPNSLVWGNANFEAEQTLPYYIMVGAINARGVRASYSTPGSNLWISGAGGEDGLGAPAMITTDLTGCSYGYARTNISDATSFDKGFEGNNAHCDFTNSMNGTSSATPVISGIIALMLEANPHLTWRDVKHILAKTADPVDFTAENEVLTHPHPALRVTGHTYDVKWLINRANNFFSNWYGFGRANALKAVMMAGNYNFPLGGSSDYREGNFIPSAPINTLIPTNATGISSKIEVDNINLPTITKIESVQVAVTVVHPFIGDLGIELTSPQGTTSRLLLINNRGIDVGETDENDHRVISLLSNAFYEEIPHGKWELKVIDGDDSADPGFLISWSIKINGH